MNNGFAALESTYSGLELEEMYDINGGALFTIVIAGVTYAVSAKAFAAIVAGAYGIGYAIGKGWAYVK
ncbi:hypothetical protein JZO73_09830 [Enterococcus plantarum]|uniref:Bacteriocin n=1 Tax=Enterococcus plantarum TaxID=1077675 RepID=A0A2W3YWJ5_9ENTE|nr:hypothetical protein [Enterococcus plantarum]MBO0467829.1 hypothetical protein [Enterococcus plantarum]PZL72126.1 hypothetical protein CI088_10965 [Enterococcus plantarum]